MQENEADLAVLIKARLRAITFWYACTWTSLGFSDILVSLARASFHKAAALANPDLSSDAPYASDEMISISWDSQEQTFSVEARIRQ